jgi:hypothetical protein
MCLDAADKKSYPGTGTVWNDRSGNGNHGTLVNGVGYNSSNLGSLSFDGVNDYVNCGNNNSINLIGNFSICVWVYLNSALASTRVIIEKGTYGNPDEYGLILSASSSLGISFQCNNSFFYSNRAFPVSKWTYSVGTLLGTNGNYYENNSLVSSGTLNPPISGGNNLSLSFRPSTSFYLNGNIAQVSIYNRALTPQEIQQNFNATRGRFEI